MMRPRRLASIFAFRMAVTLGLAMAAYAALEHYRDPRTSWATLGVTHGWHVLALGLLLYVVLLVGFDRLVGRPLGAIHVHLQNVATGRLEILHLQGSAREIVEMVGSVNLMVRRMRLGAGDADPHRTALALRDVAARLHDRAPEAAEAMASAAAALDLLATPADAGNAVTRGGARFTAPRPLAATAPGDAGAKRACCDAPGPTSS